MWLGLMPAVCVRGSACAGVMCVCWVRAVKACGKREKNHTVRASGREHGGGRLGVKQNSSKQVG